MCSWYAYTRPVEAEEVLLAETLRAAADLGRRAPRGLRPRVQAASKPRRVSKRRIVGPDRKWLKAAKQRLRLMLTVWPM